MRGWQQRGQQEAVAAEAGGLEGQKERSHRVVVRLCVSMTGGGLWQDHSSLRQETKYQGPHVASKERARKTETGY